MAWWDSFQDAPTPPPRPKTGGNWWDSFPDAPAHHDRFSQGTPGSGGKPRPTAASQELPPYLAGSVEGLREIHGDIYSGAKENIEGAPDRYPAGYGSIDS